MTSYRIVFNETDTQFLKDYKKQYKVPIQSFVEEAVQEKIWKIKVETEIEEFDRNQIRNKK